MDKLTDKAAYLLGLAEGMQLHASKSEHKLLLKVVDLLKDFAQEMEALRQDQEDLNEYMDSIDEDLGNIEELLYDEDDDDYDDGRCPHCRPDEDDSLEGEMEYECPHCGYQTKFNLADFDFEEDYLCPQCHKSFFPEGEDEDDEDDEDEDRKE